MNVSSPKDVADIKFGDQFVVDLVELDPISEDETQAEFDKRFSEGIRKRDEILAAVAEALNPAPTTLEIIRDNDPETASRVLKIADARVLAESMNIATRSKNELTLITEIKDAL